MATTVEKFKRHVESIGLTWVSQSDRGGLSIDVAFRDRRLEASLYRFTLYCGGTQLLNARLYPGNAGPALSALLDDVAIEDTGRRLRVSATVRRGKLSYALVGPGNDKRTLGDDPVFRDWIAGNVTDGMLLDYAWDLFGWS